MTITVVRELTTSDSRRAKVVIGAPRERVARSVSVVDLVFAAGELVVYRVKLQARERLFVFRTCDANRGTTKVPGVQPQVLLLLCAHTGRRIHRALRILNSVRERGRAPATLSDAFYLRASTTLASRVPIESIVTSLLRQEPAWTF